jgi:AcrR family transcriptional regulator
LATRISTRRAAERATRKPRQSRSRVTVDAILDAAIVVMKKHGTGGITTNRVADAAGVSVGSLYQYFPDKQAIYQALHERHVESVDRMISSAAKDAGSLNELVAQLVDRLIAMHVAEPHLHDLLRSTLVSGTDSAHAPLQSLLREHLSAHVDPTRLDVVSFIAARMLESLSHAAAARLPRTTEKHDVREVTRAMTAYLHSAISAGP